MTKKLFLLSLLFLIVVPTFSMSIALSDIGIEHVQEGVTRIYHGRSTSYSDIAFTFDGKYIYKGRSTSYSDVMYTFDGKYIYKGRSTSYSDIMYTFDGKYIY